MKRSKDGLYNVCEPVEYSIKEVIQLLQSYYRIGDNNIYYNTTYSDGIIKKQVSNEKYRNIYPNFVFTSFKKGIRETLIWFNKNKLNCRK